MYVSIIIDYPKKTTEKKRKQKPWENKKKLWEL